MQVVAAQEHEYRTQRDGDGHHGAVREKLKQAVGYASFIQGGIILGHKGTTFPVKKSKNQQVSIAQIKKLYLCSGSYGGIMPLTYRNTKRYARLVDGNVRNFRRQVSMVVRAF